MPLELCHTKALHRNGSDTKPLHVFPTHFVHEQLV